MSSNRELVKQAAQLLAQGEREAAEGVLMQIYLQELSKLAYSSGPPTLQIYEDDLRAAGVSVKEFKQLCGELPGIANPFFEQNTDELPFNVTPRGRASKKSIKLWFSIFVGMTSQKISNLFNILLNKIGGGGGDS